MRKSRGVVLLMALVLVILICSSCTAGQKEEVTIAYQYGLAYIPIELVKDLRMLEEACGDKYEIKWTMLNSGQAVNEGLAAGSVDVAAIGVAPFITGVVRGVDYKIVSGLSSQPLELMTNRDDVNSLKDITSESKIAMGSLGSMQHILLAMACENELGDAHALDNMVMSLSHPDAANALMSGSIDFHVASPPYLYIEQETEGIHSVEAISKVWPQGNSFVVIAATSAFKDRCPEVFEYLYTAVAEAVEYVNANKEEVAAMYCEEQGITKEQLLSYLNDPSCIYDCETHGVMDLAKFMTENGFTDEAELTEKDLYFSEAG